MYCTSTKHHTFDRHIRPFIVSYLKRVRSTAGRSTPQQGSTPWTPRSLCGPGGLTHAVFPITAPTASRHPAERTAEWLQLQTSTHWPGSRLMIETHCTLVYYIQVLLLRLCGRRLCAQWCVRSAILHHNFIIAPWWISSKLTDVHWVLFEVSIKCSCGFELLCSQTGGHIFLQKNKDWILGFTNW